MYEEAILACCLRWVFPHEYFAGAAVQMLFLPRFWRHYSTHPTGAAPPVVLAEDLQRNPEGTLRALCAALSVEGLDFASEMLAWEPGARPLIDGAWAPWWYVNTHASGGFEPPKPVPPAPMSDAIRQLVEEARPFYYLLRRHALKPLSYEEWAAEAGLPPGLATGGSNSGSSGGGGGGSGGGGGGAACSVDKRGRIVGGSKDEDETERKEKKGGTHAYTADPRNADVLIGLRDGVRDVFELTWRPEVRRLHTSHSQSTQDYKIATPMA
jgi:branched-chain amino acid aminotransferase